MGLFTVHTKSCITFHKRPSDSLKVKCLYYSSWITILQIVLYFYFYSVSQKNPAYGFLKFFPKRLEFLINFLHAYYATISTLDYKFLFQYLQL